MSRYVYHAPWEPEPRATASGDQNIVETTLSQPEYIAHNMHRAGVENPEYVFHPGIGTIMDNPIARGLLPRLPIVRSPNLPISHPDGNVTPTYVYRSPTIYPYPGATNTVQQPPPSAGGSQIVPLTQPLPLFPAPSPTVAVSSSQTSPQLTQPGTVLDSNGASITTAGGIGTWLAQSSLITGIPNWGIAAVGVFAAMMMFGGKAGRR